MKHIGLLALALSGLLSGCAATTTIDEFRPSAEPLRFAEGEKIVILGRRDAGSYETDRDFVGCVGKKIVGLDITVIPEEEFIDSLYPWFEPRTAPKGMKRLKRLMQEPAVRRKVLSENVRYMIWLDGTAETQGAEFAPKIAFAT